MTKEEGRVGIVNSKVAIEYLKNVIRLSSFYTPPPSAGEGFKALKQKALYY